MCWTSNKPKNSSTSSTHTNQTNPPCVFVGAPGSKGRRVRSIGHRLDRRAKRRGSGGGRRGHSSSDLARDLAHGLVEGVPRQRAKVLKEGERGGMSERHWAAGGGGAVEVPAPQGSGSAAAPGAPLLSRDLPSKRPGRGGRRLSGAGPAGGRAHPTALRNAHPQYQTSF